MRMPKHVTDAIDAAVEKGAKRLDARRPNWFKQLDLKTLDLGDGCQCILGQLYGGYENYSVASVVGGWVRKLTGRRSWVDVAGDYGFCTPSTCDPWVYPSGNGDYSDFRGNRSRATWNRLERAWKNEIRARLDKAAA